MHILILASGYPTEFSLNQGIFFRDQAEAFAKDKQNQVAVIAVVPVSIKTVLKRKRFSFGLTSTVKNQVRTYINTFLNIPKVNRYRVLKSRKLAMKLINAYIEEFRKPDVIHIHGFQAGLQGVEAKERFGIPFVVTEHSNQFIDDTLPAEMESFAKMVFKHADAVIAVSEPFAQIMTKRYKRNFHYIPNVVNTDVFYFDLNADRNEEFTFFNAASFVEEKNHSMLLEAFSKVLLKYPKCRLRLAGMGPLETQVRSDVQKWNISQQVDFLGMLTRAEIVLEMQQMDAFVLSSRVETFGVVLIEALSCGKPVVATRCFGPESIITSPELGILCQQEPDSLAEAMEDMIRNSSKYDKEVIRKHVIQHFSNDAVTGQLMHVYQQVISNSNT
jgi:glycosyltransferase involved in cell wall biosynthesis